MKNETKHYFNCERCHIITELPNQLETKADKLREGSNIKDYQRYMEQLKEYEMHFEREEQRYKSELKEYEEYLALPWYKKLFKIEMRHPFQISSSHLFPRPYVAMPTKYIKCPYCNSRNYI